MSNLALIFVDQVNKWVYYRSNYIVIPRMGEYVDMYSKFLNEKDMHYIVTKILHDPSPNRKKLLLDQIMSDDQWSNILLNETVDAILLVKEDCDG